MQTHPMSYRHLQRISMATHLLNSLRHLYTLWHNIATLPSNIENPAYPCLRGTTDMSTIQPTDAAVVLLVGTMAIEAFFGKARLQDVIGTYQVRNDMFLLPLPHPSGVSRWLNDPAHQQLLQAALAILSQWRDQFTL